VDQLHTSYDGSAFILNADRAIPVEGDRTFAGVELSGVVLLPEGRNGDSR